MDKVTEVLFFLNDINSEHVNNSLTFVRNIGANLLIKKTNLLENQIKFTKSLSSESKRFSDVKASSKTF